MTAAEEFVRDVALLTLDGQAVADAGGERRGEGVGPAADEPAGGVADFAPDGRAWPPGPDDADGWRAWIDAGGPEPQVRRRTDGRPVGLADALHLGGNGAVPAVAAHALAALATRAGIGRLEER